MPREATQSVCRQRYKDALICRCRTNVNVSGLCTMSSQFGFFFIKFFFLHLNRFGKCNSVYLSRNSITTVEELLNVKIICIRRNRNTLRRVRHLPRLTGFPNNFRQRRRRNLRYKQGTISKRD